MRSTKSYLIGLGCLLIGVMVGKALFKGHSGQQDQSKPRYIPTRVRFLQPLRKDETGEWSRRTWDLTTLRYQQKDTQDPVVHLVEGPVKEEQIWVLTLDGPGYRHPVVLTLGAPENP